MRRSEVAVIGAGPIGIEMAIALKQANVSFFHFEAGVIGQTVLTYPPGTKIFSSKDKLALAGIPIVTRTEDCTREEYLEYLHTLVDRCGLSVRTLERVTSIRRQADSFLLITLTADGRTNSYTVERVVIATGSFSVPDYLAIAGEDLPHVSHYCAQPELYAGRRVLIVGGRNSALESAIRCVEAGASVTISYRQATFDPRRTKRRLVEEAHRLIAASRIRALFNTVPRSISPSHVLLQSTKRADRYNVRADHVLLLTGYLPDVSLCKEAGVITDPETFAPTFNEDTMETNVEGLYVAGTLSSGKQYDVRVFIETCHVHVEKILSSILSKVRRGGKTRGREAGGEGEEQRRPL